MTEIYSVTERPPVREDADAQGCVLAWDEHGSGWVIRHYLNLAGKRWWTKLPERPGQRREETR